MVQFLHTDPCIFSMLELHFSTVIFMLHLFAYARILLNSSAIRMHSCMHILDFRIVLFKWIFMQFCSTCLIQEYYANLVQFLCTHPCISQSRNCTFRPQFPCISAALCYNKNITQVLCISYACLRLYYLFPGLLFSVRSVIDVWNRQWCIFYCNFRIITQITAKIQPNCDGRLFGPGFV